MKLCTFLKSRMESIRRTTRETLQKIMITLGPKYLHHLLKEMNTLLTKGFQVHVLVYTVQSVLLVLKPYFQKYDINHNLQSILSVSTIIVTSYNIYIYKFISYKKIHFIIEIFVNIKISMFIILKEHL